MAHERDSDFTNEQDNEPKDEQGQPRMANQGAEGSFGGESSGSQSGSADSNGSSIAGGANAGQGLGSGRRDDGTSGQPIGGNDSATGTGTTLTQGADFGHGTTSNAGGSSVGSNQSSGGSSGVSGGQGFVGSQGDNSSDYLQDNQSASDAPASGGTDFAKQGRGAPEDEDGQESGGGDSA